MSQNKENDFKHPAYKPKILHRCNADLHLQQKSINNTNELEHIRKEMTLLKGEHI